MKKTVLELMSKVALQESKKQADSACLFFGYQPKQPEAVKKLKK